MSSHTTDKQHGTNISQVELLTKARANDQQVSKIESKQKQIPYGIQHTAQSHQGSHVTYRDQNMIAAPVL